MSNTRFYAQRMLFWSGMALLAWPVYELAVRADAMAGPLGMFIRMAAGERIPFFTALSYVDWSIFAAPAYLLCCILLGILALCLRWHDKGWIWLMPIAISLGLYGYCRQEFFRVELYHMIEALPFAGILLGCGLHMIANIGESRRAQMRRRPKAFPLKQRTE